MTSHRSDPLQRAGLITIAKSHQVLLPWKPSAAHSNKTKENGWDGGFLLKNLFDTWSCLFLNCRWKVKGLTRGYYVSLTAITWNALVRRRTSSDWGLSGVWWCRGVEVRDSETCVCWYCVCVDTVCVSPLTSLEHVHILTTNPSPVNSSRSLDLHLFNGFTDETTNGIRPYFSYFPFLSFSFSLIWLYVTCTLQFCSLASKYFIVFILEKTEWTFDWSHRHKHWARSSRSHRQARAITVRLDRSTHLSVSASFLFLRSLHIFSLS